MNRKGMTRRRMIQATLAAGMALSTGRIASASVKTTQVDASGYFTIDKRGGRWWFITPEGEPFFSIGMNHIDPASLRFVENGHIWREKYGNSMRRWLTESVAPNLKSWGFNSIGWTQEVITRGPTNHRHSRHFTYDEYQWAGLPYCHQLPFGDFHQWESETRNPDFFSEEFAEWCDHVAREHCVPLSKDPKLIGYFYIDCPTWVHIRKHNVWKGPLFDPDKLETKAGRAELRNLATQWYKVTHDAIRRYDPHHLILGDRYEANAALPIEVVEAAAPYVDVLSFQDFRDPVAHLAEWYRQTGKPVLWADGAHTIKTTSPDGETCLHTDGKWWGEALAGLRQNPGCIGAHICGAYIRNRSRRRGLLDPFENPDTPNVKLITDANRQMESWVKRMTSE